MVDKPESRASDKILTAAMELFITRGYRGTTINTIASEAGVAVQTVYFNFRNKANILRNLIDINVAGDSDDISTLERQWVKDAVAHPDAEKQLELQVAGAATIFRRMGRLLSALHRATDDDATATALWEENQRQRHTVQRQFILALRKKAPLRKGLTVRRAVDIAYAVLGPEQYELLVHQQGWSVREWERHCHRVLVNELLGTS